MRLDRSLRVITRELDRPSSNSSTGDMGAYRGHGSSINIQSIAELLAMKSDKSFVPSHKMKDRTRSTEQISIEPVLEYRETPLIESEQPEQPTPILSQTHGYFRLPLLCTERQTDAPEARQSNPHPHLLCTYVPDQVLAPDPGGLDGSADQAGSGEPDPPRGTHDAQPEPERDAKVRVPVRAHVRQHLGPPGVAVLGAAGGGRRRHGCGCCCCCFGLLRCFFFFFARAVLISGPIAHTVQPDK
jgi:hypothetical protein